MSKGKSKKLKHHPFGCVNKSDGSSIEGKALPFAARVDVAFRTPP
jgi:hypothetical protein